MSNKLYEENDIQNIANAIRNKNGTEDTYKVSQMSTAIDSIEVIEQATAEGEILNLANTKAMPYSDYVVEGKSEQEGEPSPSNPSEIHSVADDVNLFDISSTSIRYGDISKEIVDNHLILTATGTSGAQLVENYVKNVDSSKNYTLSYKAKKIVKGTDGQPYLQVVVYGSNDDNTYTSLQFIRETNPVEGQEYFFNYTITGYKYYRFYIYNNSGTPVTIGEKTEYWDIKFQEGTIATPYSPYNQGTVTIKQRGKNEINLNRTLGTPSNASYDASSKRLFNYNNYIIGITSNNYYLTSKISSYNVQNNTIKVEVNGSGYGVGFPIKLKPNTSYILSYDTDLEANQNSGIGFYKSDGTYISNINSLLTNNYINFTTPSNCDFAVIIFRPPVNTELTYRNIQLEEGSTVTTYEPYQGNDYTIQTEPLRSLPNGVKDSKDTKQHTRVGVKVFDGSENTWELNKTLDKTIRFRNWNADINSTDVNNLDLVSDYFIQKKWVKSIYLNLEEEYMAQSTTNDIYFSFNKGFLPSDTLEGLKTWLSSNPVTVLYPLAEEIIEPLTQNQATTMLDIIKTGSYEGTTNIYTDEDVKSTIGVGYYKKG